jgi:hypothetical protein
VERWRGGEVERRGSRLSSDSKLRPHTFCIARSKKCQLRIRDVILNTRNIRTAI